MIEIRYIKNTGELTAWCGDPKQFGNLARNRPQEATAILDVDVPPKPINAYIYNGITLVKNDDYTEPKPARDLAKEIDGIKERLGVIENVKST